MLMESFAARLDRINEIAGKFFSWSTTFLVWLICIDVVMRYLFSYTLIWIIELETYLFAVVFLLTSGYALQKDKHVRVDLFYAGYSERKKAWVDLLGGIFLLLPWAGISAYVCFYYFSKSVYINESSPQPGGLPALYVLKFILFLGFVLLLIQAVSQIIKSALKLKGDSATTDSMTQLEPGSKPMS